jgi:hypothetical protein
LRLEVHSLCCRPAKCILEMDQTDFLGITIGKGEVWVSDAKVDAITQEKPLTIRKAVQGFLGMVNYHRRFIKDYSRMACLLHELMKEVPFIWGRAEEEAFQSIKSALVSAPVLALPCDEGRFQLEMDSSNVATGAVLSQL